MKIYRQKNERPPSKFKNPFKDKRFVIILIAIIVVIIALLVIARIHTIDEEKKTYTVVGVDVSAYQGTIDWKTLEKQDISFAYIKATEGADYVDKKFTENWKNIDKTGIVKGAYLFWRFEEDGKKQADYFIKTVPKEKGTLPPAIDVELYGEYEEKPMEKDKVVKNLQTTIDAIRDQYKMDPVIYTNYRTYSLYLDGEFEGLKIWIVDLSNNQPDLSGNHEWEFWQFTQRAILKGYQGDTRFIDLDLYNGNLNELHEEN